MSKRVNRSFSAFMISVVGVLDEISVKPTISAKRKQTHSWRSEIGFPFMRL